MEKELLGRPVADMERRIQLLEKLEKEVPGFLRDLEKMFGPRNPNFEFGGIKQGEKGEDPHIRFRRDASGGVVDIYLTENALEDPDKTWAKWQLAHECLHLIDPHKNPTNVLEEGLATYHQNDKVPRKCVISKCYVDAESLVKSFMKTLPDAIKRLRKECSVAIGDITEDVLIQYCPEVGARAQALTASFNSGTS